MKLLQQLFTTLRDFFIGSQRLPPLPAQATVLRHGKRQGFQRRHGIKQLVDLEGAHHATLDAFMRCQAADVSPFQRDAAAGRLQHTGEQIDQRGFARAIGPDEGVAGALPEFEVDVVSSGDAAEIFG